jgi:hypothetical protein
MLYKKHAEQIPPFQLTLGSFSIYVSVCGLNLMERISKPL